MQDNRRYEYRILADLTIEEISLEQKKPALKGSIRELSASGCRLEANVDLRINQIVSLSFNLAGGHNIKDIRGRVVRRLSHRTHKVVALEFIEVSEENQYKIREFIVWKEDQEAKL